MRTFMIDGKRKTWEVYARIYMLTAIYVSLSAPRMIKITQSHIVWCVTEITQPLKEWCMTDYGNNMKEMPTKCDS